MTESLYYVYFRSVLIFGELNIAEREESKVKRYLYRLANEVNDGVERLSSWLIRRLHKGKVVQDDCHVFMLACLLLIFVMVPLTLLSIAFDRSEVRTGIEITVFFFLLACLFWWLAERFAPHG